MSTLYHQLEALTVSDLEELGEDYAGLGFTDLAERFAELAEARSRTEHAVWDQQYRASADYEAACEGARADSLTEDLEMALIALLPQLADRPVMAVRSAA
jgi:lipopolysaccharide biosynthesis regulator YciM